jgi:hypothetical protein
MCLLGKQHLAVPALIECYAADIRTSLGHPTGGECAPVSLHLADLGSAGSIAGSKHQILWRACRDKAKAYRTSEDEEETRVYHAEHELESLSLVYHID